MEYKIIGVSSSAVAELDYLIEEVSTSWRYNSTPCNGLYTICLNDAWLEIEHGHIYIVCDDTRFLLYHCMFESIVIS